MTKSPAGDPEGGGTPDPADTADYIAQISSELAAMARRSRLDLLAYLLEMARIEAAHCADQPDAGRQ